MKAAAASPGKSALVLCLEGQLIQRRKPARAAGWFPRLVLSLGLDKEDRGCRWKTSLDCENIGVRCRRPGFLL